ncbi:MAG: DnaJ domain-containing protein [Polyangiaceae bacterium]
MAPPSIHPPPPNEPVELAEEVDLDLEKKRRILELYERLDEMSYYDLLGVPFDADKKQVKGAYYKLAPEFHPDSYFRKNLGSFKPKIEAIFTRITLAHDVLTARQRRAEYDAYLDQAVRNRSLEDALAQAEQEARAVEEQIERAVRATAPPEPPPAPERPALSAEQRREILARRLTGQNFARLQARHHQGGANGSPLPPPVDSPEAKRAAAQTLKARYDAAKAEALRVRITNYQKVAEAAILENDFAKAANSYRIAAHLAPEDAGLQRRSEEVQRLAAAALSAGYLKQAAYEEHEGRWADASLSYARAAEGRPDDAFAHERAGFATIKSGGSARRAVEYARRAVELQPQNPDNRITLARAYLAAGFGVSALAELDRALASGPMDAQHKQIVGELRDQAHRLNKLG